MERLLSLPEIQEVNAFSFLHAVLGKQITMGYEEVLKKKALKVQSDGSYHFPSGNCIKNMFQKFIL